MTRQKSRLSILGGFALFLLSVTSCSEMQQIPMNQAQTDSYNRCMSTHWSSLADSALFGVAGYEYHQNMVLNCRQVALIPVSAISNQPVSADQPRPVVSR